VKTALKLLIFDKVTDKTKLAPFFMAHGVRIALISPARNTNNFTRLIQLCGQYL